MQHLTPVSSSLPRSLTALAALLGALLASTATAVETKILEERFAANDRTNVNLPTTAAWYYSGVTTEITDNAAGSLTLNGMAASRTLLAQFTSVKLDNIGDSLSLSFSFSGTVGTSTTSRNFRFGLFDSGTASLVSTDGFGNVFEGYTGYLLALNTKSEIIANEGSMNAKLSGNNLLSTNQVTRFGDPVIDSFGLTSGETYTASLIIKRESATQVSITLGFVGDGFTDYSQKWTTTAYAYTTFNTFAIGTGGKDTFDTLTLNSVDIVYTSAIPEASTAALLFGMVACLAVFAFHRRR